MNKIFLNYGKCLFLIIAITCCSNASAQSVIQYDAVSPDVGSLLRVQDVSVNLYTGRPNISIPLHSISLKNYSYDIQLIYNAEGNKPDMPVGNVGLGWSITNGQISRIANGLPDEIYTFSEYSDRTDREDWYKESNLYKYYNPSDSNDNLEHEPDLDEFIINIGQINASFYMYRDKGGVIRTKIASQNSSYFEVKDVEIGTFSEIPFAETELYNPDQDRTYHPKISIEPRPILLKEITIIDSNGVVYVFGGDISSVDLSCQYRPDPSYRVDFDQYGRRKLKGFDALGTPIYSTKLGDNFHSSLYGTPTTWHIKQITLPNGEYIKFDYLKENVNITERRVLYDNDTFGFELDYIHSSSVSPSELPTGVNPQYNLLLERTHDIVYPSLLTKIYASNGETVDFTLSKRNDLPTYGMYEQRQLFLEDNYGNNINEIINKAYSYKLDGMKTRNRMVNFYYTDTKTRRLQLDSLKINQKEVYKFQYNPLPLPPYARTLTDNWGYYNGKNYYAERQLKFENLYTFRQPDSTYVKAEILEKIIYPTGGEADFQYELHTYSKIAGQYPFEIRSENNYAGGVRIKRITLSDFKSSQTNQTKEFLYENEDGTSSGILSVIPKYMASGKGPFHYEYNGKPITGQYAYDTKTDTQMNWVDQFHISYSRVTELRSDSSKIIYSFINHDLIKDEPSLQDFAFGMTDNLQHKYTSRKLSRGLPQSVEYYNTTKKLLKKERFEYHSDASDYLKSINHFAFMGYQPIRVSANKIYTYFPFLQKKETVLYTDCDSIHEAEEYEYNEYRLLTCTKKYTDNSDDNSTLETRTKYLSDLMEEYDNTASDSIPYDSPLKIYDTMRSRGLLSYPVETVARRNGKVTSAEVTTYKLSDKFAVQDKQYQLESDVPLSNYSSFKLLNSTQYSMDNRCALEMEYLDYDSQCNPVNVADKAGIKTTYLWGYKDLYPIAKVVNAQNTLKSVFQYGEVRTTKYINLQYSPLFVNEKEHIFYTSKAGNVEITLSGALGYNWYVTGHLDNTPFNLVQVRSSDYEDRPWDDYLEVYTYNVTLNVPAGYHTLSINGIDAYKEASPYICDGDLHFSYWALESTDPETSGSDDVYYNSFETFSSSPNSFGYHSNKSHIGPYDVSMTTTPGKEYFIDYRVLKDGTWKYVKRDFINNSETIDEGRYPIDDVRVYPKDALITTYNYYPLIGLRSKTNERGVSESYKYNDFGELLSVMDNDMNVVKKYDYFYQGQSAEPEPTYHNKEIRETFTRNTCDASLGEIGKSIDFVVPANKYSSFISQEDANQKAYVDLLNNGQQYANENAECGSDIILSVYNPKEKGYYLTFQWGVQGHIVTDYYEISPSHKIADTGDILKDYEPVKVYIPRSRYRIVQASPQDDRWEYDDLSIKSSRNNTDLDYNITDYSGYEDTYVIGGYPFIY